MTPHQFVDRWRHVDQKERSASQSHFIDLCALLGVPGPIEADPTGVDYAFERGATKSSGGEGWADVWKRGCFGWEYKGPRDLGDEGVSERLLALNLERAGGVRPDDRLAMMGSVQLIGVSEAADHPAMNRRATITTPAEAG